MPKDIDDALRDWPYKPDAGSLVARQVRARDGRWVIQVRQELGILQMEIDGRPDGLRPYGFRTFLDYLRHRAADRGLHAARSKTLPPTWTMHADLQSEFDREIVQFYQRRMAWLALHRYDRMLADAEHSLALLDFARRHCDDPEFVAGHERFRSLVLFHRAQARAALALERHEPELAVDAVREAVAAIEHHHDQWTQLHDEADETPALALIEQLHEIEREIRRSFNVRSTLREQLDEAVAREDYERAARLRDQIRAQSRRQP
ncbi:MAG: hypothetical protein KatS3mg108_2634 [Isosphaeraceae bacterium]|jgi:hypothetical protein|nr:MAG: hypothetical protein KatS3mg108_2634 [Isosphaeraceae bacterium]